MDIKVLGCWIHYSNGLFRIIKEKNYFCIQSQSTGNTYFHSNTIQDLLKETGVSSFPISLFKKQIWI